MKTLIKTTALSLDHLPTLTAIVFTPEPAVGTCTELASPLSITGWGGIYGTLCNKPTDPQKDMSNPGNKPVNHQSWGENNSGACLHQL